MLRLIIKAEVASLKRRLKLRLDPLTMVRDAAHFVLEERPFANSGQPRILQCKVRAAQDRFGLGTIFRNSDNAYRQADRLQMSSELVRHHHPVD